MKRESSGFSHGECQTCNSKEAAIVASQLEKSKVKPAERKNITAVVLDDGGVSDIMF